MSNLLEINQWIDMSVFAAVKIYAFLVVQERKPSHAQRLKNFMSSIYKHKDRHISMLELHEALCLDTQHFRILDKGKILELSLDFQKTKWGGHEFYASLKPFLLRQNYSDKYLCPLTAFYKLYYHLDHINYNPAEEQAPPSSLVSLVGQMDRLSQSCLPPIPSDMEDVSIATKHANGPAACHWGGWMADFKTLTVVKECKEPKIQHLVGWIHNQGSPAAAKNNRLPPKLLTQCEPTSCASLEASKPSSLHSNLDPEALSPSLGPTPAQAEHICLHHDPPYQGPSNS
ncbi:hypothetical protein M427DRAFT_43972 [Gonapodya prolifera JEL478]|uniref:Uncharacterized protein n=1 Tax=Gonapodya prolifera (strain JEL478) TaxID=1344416 RepID=A0A139AHZ9_GONPJ|nr:hypothetical protein M427DRAFT_43972 [Gonapodya prolifera JEL478]|eukprot:KXS16174.1 hypothetical protein M427DRAFT_43972 [Gonapodya prolifera JEL478]